MARIPPLTHHRTPRRILRAKCQVVRERDFRLVADQVVDLSPTGALVMPADPVLTGEAVIISFKLPHIPYWLDAEAIVARVVHGRRPGEHTRGLALTSQLPSGTPRECQHPESPGRLTRVVAATPPEGQRRFCQRSRQLVTRAISDRKTSP
jgi:hypothetical protein